MIDEGALDGVERAFAIHVEPGRVSHVVAWRAGTILAAFDNFSVTFRGAGGHASTPHLAKDPIPAIGPFVDGLSHVAAREIDPYDRAVLSVTQVSAGTADNVIPPTASCVGTIRSLGKKGRERARAALVRVAKGVAASRGLEVDVDLVEGYPPTINDADAVASVVATSRAMGLVDEQMIGPFMGAEDFSYILDRVPGAFVFLGSRVADGGPLHSDLMKLDEDVLATGSALHVAVALRMLSD
jgi:hippurate hydrolase